MDRRTGQQFCSRDRGSEFTLKGAALGRLQSPCGATRWRKPGLRQAENLQLLLKYLRTHPCVDCGERDPVVLDFDHRDPSLKRMEVSLLLWRSTWALVEAEIARCDVRCANCHRRRTAIPRHCGIPHRTEHMF